MEKLALSVDETAEMIGISPRMVYVLIRSGQLQSIKLGKRRLIRQSDLTRFVEELEAA